MTKEEAKELCIIKWTYIVNHNGEIDVSQLEFDLPQLEKLVNNCGYCELYLKSTPFPCKECPINLGLNVNIHYVSCMNPKHPYRIWMLDPSYENALSVLNLIKKS